MTTKHTPGPWRLSTSSNIGNLVEGPTGQRLFDGDNGFRTVASFQSCLPSGAKYDAEEANAAANGRLIALAPELAEALRELTANVDALVRNIGSDEARASWRRPIADARALLARLDATP